MRESKGEAGSGASMGSVGTKDFGGWTRAIVNELGEHRTIAVG